MDSIKNIINFFQEKLKPLAIDNCKFIEHQRNIFYFSKFSIDIEEFKSIFSMIRLIKENTFEGLIDKIKITVDSALIFTDSNLTEKDKVMTLFSVCYLHYYSCFAYDASNSFASYYNDEFFALCEKFRFVIKIHEVFKAFCYEFYNEMHLQIKKINYDQIQKMYQYYNSSIIEEQKTAFMSNNNPIDMLKKHLNKKKEGHTCFLKNSKLLTHLIAAKERMIDMVLENRTKRIFSDTQMQQSINELMDKLHTISKQTYSISNEEHPFREEMPKDKKKEMQVDDDDKMNTLPSESNNSSIYSKRVLSELIKCEINDEIRVQINEISQKVDELFLDVLLNQGEKNTNIINPFLCYIIEINSTIIKLIPEYSNIDDLILRFIVPAKNLYNNFFEIYFSIYDLKYTGIETVGCILSKRNFQFRFSTTVYSFFKSLTDVMFQKKNKVNDKMDEVIDTFFNEQFKLWENTIKEKGQELTHFCLV